MPTDRPQGRYQAVGTVPIYRDEATGAIVVDPADLPEEQDGYDDGYEDPDDEDPDDEEEDEEESVGAEHVEDRKADDDAQPSPVEPGFYLTLRLLNGKGGTIGYTMVQVMNLDKLWHLAFVLHLHLPVSTTTPKAYAVEVQWPFDIDFVRSLRDRLGHRDSVYEQIITRAAGTAQRTLPVYYDPRAKEPALVIDLDLTDPNQRATPSWASEWNRRASILLERYTPAQAAQLRAEREKVWRGVPIQETARKFVVAYADYADPVPTPEPQPKSSPFQATGTLALSGAKRAGTMVLATRAIGPLRALVRSLVTRLAPEQRALLDSPAGEILLDLATPLVLHGLAAHGMLPGGELLQSTAALAYEGHLVHRGMQIADGLVDALTRSPQELAAVRMLAAEVVTKSAAQAVSQAPVVVEEPEPVKPPRAPRKRRVKERAL